MKMHPSLRKHDSCTCCTLRFSKPSVINKTFSQSAGLICKNYDSKMLCGFQYMLVTPPTFLKWNKFYIPLWNLWRCFCVKNATQREEALNDLVTVPTGPSKMVPITFDD